MAAKWKSQPREVLQSWIDALAVVNLDKFNEWEAGFIVDMARRIQAGLALTEAQHNKLEDIYANKTN